MSISNSKPASGEWRQFERFGRKLLLFLLPGFVMVLLPYIWLDPFKVIHNHRDFSPDFHDGIGPYVDADYVSTQVFINNRERHAYRSFVFGSSRASGFRATDWGGHIGDPAPYAFLASGESLRGIYDKVRYLDRIGQPMDNVLLVVDRSLVARIVNNQDSMLTITHPATSGESWLTFHLVFLKHYVSDLYFMRYLDLRIFEKRRESMDPYFNKLELFFQPITNDWIFVKSEHDILVDHAAYIKSREEAFYPRSGIYKEDEAAILTDTHLQMLRAMQEIFSRRGTQLTVIISPLYDQVTFNRSDLLALRKIFGESRVHDYSGINVYTEAVSNYYESSHFRYVVGRQIMQSIFGPPRRRTAADGTSAAGDREQ